MTDSFSVSAVGDLQLGDSPTTVGYGFFSRYRGTALDPLFDETRGLIAGADVVFGNLETTLVAPAVGEKRRSALQMRGEPQFAAALRRVGFNVLNVANNHAVQHGDETFHRTVATVREAGIACVGVRGEGPWASEPALLRGGRIGVLGYCQRPRQWGSAVPPYAEGTRAEICADVRRLRETGAIVIVSLHWGEEFVPVPSNEELRLGHDIIDAGATLILGHHPHVTRPAEFYKRGAIVHSLGNFMGDMTWYRPFRSGAIFRCRLSEDGVSDARITPTKLATDYRPRPELPELAPLLTSDMRSMDETTYQRAIATTWRDQRLAGYIDLIAKLPRIPFPILVQLTTQTVKNKVAAVITRITGREASA